MSNQFICYIVVGGLGVGSLAVGIVGAVREHKREVREKAQRKFKDLYSNANAQAHTHLI